MHDKIPRRGKTQAESIMRLKWIREKRKMILDPEGKTRYDMYTVVADGGANVRSLPLTENTGI